jgi:hypothetical protein
MADEKKKNFLPPPSDHKISLPAAIEFVRLYRRYAGPAAEKGGFFWAEPVRKLLAQKGVVGLRYYHGTDDKGRYRIILVAVDKEGKDIVTGVVGSSAPQPSKSGGKTAKAMMAMSGSGDELLEEHFPCPPFCPPTGPFA